MADAFQYQSEGLDSPADGHTAITPSDDQDVSPKPRALYCEADGTVSIADKAGTVLTYTLTQGQILPFRATKVLATGTTATVYGWD